MLNRIWPLILILTTTISQPLWAEDILIITAANSVLRPLSVKQLQNIYRKKNLINHEGAPWNPINLSANHPVRQAFSKKLFNQSPGDMESYWNIQYFNGIRPPHVVSSEEAMLRFVANTPNAIGYILACHADERVQVILKLNVSETFEPSCGSVEH
jgi:ABC-type phosphate transport system substrate-binding protein